MSLPGLSFFASLHVCHSLALPSLFLSLFSFLSHKPQVSEFGNPVRATSLTCPHALLHRELPRRAEHRTKANGFPILAPFLGVRGEQNDECTATNRRLKSKSHASNELGLGLFWFRQFRFNHAHYYRFRVDSNDLRCIFSLHIAHFIEMFQCWVWHFNPHRISFWTDSTGVEARRADAHTQCERIQGVIEEEEERARAVMTGLTRWNENRRKRTI